MEFPERKQVSFGNLAKKLSGLSSEHKRVALETAASLASASLRVSREFVESVVVAAEVFSPEQIKLWAEIGKRLAVSNPETGVKFFNQDVRNFALITERGRTFALQICLRQQILSNNIALETFNQIPELAKEIQDKEFFTQVLQIVNEVAQRSAKHSAEILKLTPKLSKVVESFGYNQKEVSKAVTTLALSFAGRTGGMTADLWQTLPESLEKLTAEKATTLIEKALDFLEYGGNVTLHFLSAGSEVAKYQEEVFDSWCGLLKRQANYGNALLIAFLRASPEFFDQVLAKQKRSLETVSKVLSIIGNIADVDAESALAAFRSAPKALTKVSLTQFEDWVSKGLKQNENLKARRSFFALETRRSNLILHEKTEGLSLEKVRNILKNYIEGLTGKEIEIEAISTMPQEARINDGKTIYLPSVVAEFNDEELDFRLYKVLAAHGAGQIEFGTYEKDTPELKAAYAALSEYYSATPEQLDAFSLAGYIQEISKGERALTDEELARELEKTKKTLPENSDYRAVLKVFPDPKLAKKIFGTLENARIDRRLRRTYRGLVRDLDLMQEVLRRTRPSIFELPSHLVPFELLFQVTLCGGANEEARRFYGQVVSEIETVIDYYLSNQNASVADTLMAASRVYSLFQNINPQHQTDGQEEQNLQEEKEIAEAFSEQSESENKRNRHREKSADARELFTAWNNWEDEPEEFQDLRGTENWLNSEIPEQPLEDGDLAFLYDEWDREINDYRVGWSRVIEKKVKQGDKTFVEITRSRYRGLISSIKHQFQMLKPENLSKIHRELDGEDYDLNALVDYVIDRKADGQQSERIYTKKLRKRRDVAVSILLDQSSSTARTITRNPLQPYTYPGRRIIEIEKEGLILMAEALEAIGDSYSICGFTSEGRRNVKFYIVKDFNEKYSEEIERRIGGITFQNNTRLGAAIRHATAKLLQQEARTKLLIVLTDGRPYDHDYGDARYAREDVREALVEAKIKGVRPFCITIDRDLEAELKELYGDVGYTIIDDVLSLPEKMPGIYRKLTT
ncbi:MAG: VWA domain-containing protein [Acidobacteriota bacterium]|nr:VWA domain-containing protein [Acidobacteriota bacterium]